MFAFQGLNARHFIGTFKALPLVAEFGSLLVEPVDVADFIVKIGFIRWGEPIASQMGLDLSLFLKAWPHGEVRCVQQSCASSVHQRFHAHSSV